MRQENKKLVRKLSREIPLPHAKRIESRRGKVKRYNQKELLEEANR